MDRGRDSPGARRTRAPATFLLWEGSRPPSTPTGPFPVRIREKPDAVYTTRLLICQSQNRRSMCQPKRTTNRFQEMNRGGPRRSHDPEVLGRQEENEAQRRSGGADDDARPVERSAPCGGQDIGERSGLDQRRDERNEKDDDGEKAQGTGPSPCGARVASHGGRDGRRG